MRRSNCVLQSFSDGAGEVKGKINTILGFGLFSGNAFFILKHIKKYFCRLLKCDCLGEVMLKWKG